MTPPSRCWVGSKRCRWSDSRNTGSCDRLWWSCLWMTDRPSPPSECCRRWRGELESGRICSWPSCPRPASSCVRTRRTSSAGSPAPEENREKMGFSDWLMSYSSLYDADMRCEVSGFHKIFDGKCPLKAQVWLKIQVRYKLQVLPTGHEPNMKHQTAAPRSSFFS